MFYTFIQNNTDGEFIRDDSVSNFVIIEAESAKDANIFAEGIGIYFSGVKSGKDRGYCGDRWVKVHENDGTDTPQIFGKKPQDIEDHYLNNGSVYARVFFDNGVIQEYRVN